MTNVLVLALLLFTTVLSRATSIEAASHRRYNHDDIDLQNDRSTRDEQLDKDNLLSALLEEYSRGLPQRYQEPSPDIADERMLERLQEAAAESEMRDVAMGLNLAEAADIIGQGEDEGRRVPFGDSGPLSDNLPDLAAAGDADSPPIEISERAWSAPCINPAACPPINPYKRNGAPLNVAEQMAGDGDSDLSARPSGYRRLQRIIQAMQSLLRSDEE